MSPQDEAEFRATTDGALQRFEAELAALAPRAAQLDRDHLMFLAGQASAGLPAGGHLSRRWAWPAAFSAMSALAASLLLMLVIRPAPQVIEKIVRVPVEAVPGPVATQANGEQYAASLGQAISSELPRAVVAKHPRQREPAESAEYLDLRDRVLAMGIDSWQSQSRPSGGGSDAAPVNYHDLLDSLLRDG